MLLVTVISRFSAAGNGLVPVVTPTSAETEGHRIFVKKAPLKANVKDSHWIARALTPIQK